MIFNTDDCRTADERFGTFVSARESESLLAGISASVSRPENGIFGPDSLSWRINRESALFFGAGRAALLQLAHPWVAAALAEHSTVMNRPIERFHNTFRVVFTMVFGSLGQALAAARHLYALHTRIRGEMPAEIAAVEARLAVRGQRDRRAALGLCNAGGKRGAGLRLRAARAHRGRARAILRRIENTGRALRPSRGGAAGELGGVRRLQPGNARVRGAGRERCGARYGAQPAGGRRLVDSPAALVSRVDRGVDAGALPRGICAGIRRGRSSEPPRAPSDACRNLPQAAASPSVYRPVARGAGAARRAASRARSPD